MRDYVKRVPFIYYASGYTYRKTSQEKEDNEEAFVQLLRRRQFLAQPVLAMREDTVRFGSKCPLVLPCRGEHWILVHSLAAALPFK